MLSPCCSVAVGERVAVLRGLRAEQPAVVQADTKASAPPTSVWWVKGDDHRPRLATRKYPSQLNKSDISANYYGARDIRMVDEFVSGEYCLLYRCSSLIPWRHPMVAS